VSRRPRTRALVCRLALAHPDAVDRLGRVVDDDRRARLAGQALAERPVEVRRRRRGERRHVRLGGQAVGDEEVGLRARDRRERVGALCGGDERDARRPTAGEERPERRVRGAAVEEGVGLVDEEPRQPCGPVGDPRVVQRPGDGGDGADTARL
jgi:hypothetical protein